MYSILDIEGDGGPYRAENIIEIAIYRFDGQAVTDQFISLVNPQSEITPYVQKLTGITPKMVKTAPKFHELARRIIEITADTTLVGHNVDFDYRMLRQSFKRLGYDFRINTIDTIPLAQKLLPGLPSYSLPKLCKSVEIPLTQAHRAAGDARATMQLFKMLLNKDVNNEIIQQQLEETNAKSYINKIKLLTQDLPGEKGIVYFQNAEGRILASYFADNANRYAKKIFNSRAARHQKLQAETEQTNFEPVGNNLLAALILKSKGLKPKATFPLGLFDRDGNLITEKTTRNSGEPLVRFSSYSQAAKALRYISASEQLSEAGHLQALLDLKEKTALYTIPGRNLSEKAFVCLEKGRIVSFGFYELYTQLSRRSLIDKLAIPVENSDNELLNLLKLMILSGGATETAMPG